MKYTTLFSILIISFGCGKSSDVHPNTNEPPSRFQVINYYSKAPLDSVAIDCFNHQLTTPDSTIYTDSNGYFFVSTYSLPNVQPRKVDWWSPLYTFGHVFSLGNFFSHDTLFMYKPRTAVVTVIFDSIMDYPYTDGFSLTNNLKFAGAYPFSPARTDLFTEKPLVPSTLHFTITFIDSIENELVFELDKGNEGYETRVDTLFYPEALDSLSFVFHY